MPPGLRDLLKKRRVVCGISNTVKDLTDFCSSFHQAEQVCRLAHIIDPEEYIYNYPEYYLLSLIDLASDKAQLSKALPIKLRRAYFDEKSISESTAAIVREYLKNNCSIAETAETMHLHRNSVLYHIHKFKNIVKTDLRSPAEQEMYRIALSILRYLEAQT